MKILIALTIKDIKNRKTVDIIIYEYHTILYYFVFYYLIWLWDSYKCKKKLIKKERKWDLYYKK